MPAESDLPQSYQDRLADLRAVNTHETFTVNARAVAFGTDATAPARTLRHLDAAFSPLDADYYTIEGTPYGYGTARANGLLDRLLARDVADSPALRRHRLPFTRNTSPAIVAGSASLGGFCLTGGDALSSTARRALGTTPPDRTGLELPATEILDRYLDVEGMAFGYPKTADRQPLDTQAALPPAVQQLHTAIFGATGSGKTAEGQQMQLTNHAATDGADIYLDVKGDGSPEAYARCHYARYDDLDDVYYFDCEEYLPVLPLLSIEPQLEAGQSREQAVGNVVDHYVATLAAAAPDEDRFSDASSSVKVIRRLTRALFDPVHGADTISHRDVMDAATTLRETGSPPPVSDPHLHQKLVTATIGGDESFANIMRGATDRLGNLTEDGRLAPLFTADPGDDRAGTFDLRDHLDEDCVIVFDMGGYSERARTLLSVVVLSHLWRALQRRQAATPLGVAPPLVNCYLEEAADVAKTGILQEMLSKGRSFGVGFTVAMQFPEQVRDSHPEVYRELVNDVGTIITGSVGVDRRLAERLSTKSMDREAVANRLRDLQRGEWLVRPAAPFAEEKPQPFYVQSAALPPGHPDGDEPLTGRAKTLFDAAFETARARTRRDHGVEVARPATGTPEPAGAAETDPESVAALTGATSPIPNTDRFPDCITYLDEPPYPLVCPECDARYAGSAAGMRRAIECHNSLDAVDRDDVPICTLDLQLTVAERAASDYSDAQLRFLTAVYMAHQQRFDHELEYDIVWDSMTLLEAYVGIESDAVQALVDDGLLAVDCTRPYKLYTVTPDGRDEIGVGHREGIAYGDGTGDLSESSLHVAMVEVAARLLEQEFVGPDAPGHEVRRYPEVEDGRLDAAAVDADGDVVAAAEAERINNDRREAIPADYDKMAACDPDEAWWIVKTRGDGHDLLAALHDPPDGEPRVDQVYSESMAPQRYKLDEPGLTEVHTFEYARDTLLETDGP